jgi:putative Mg2+ transporter-C (MgtC) family protein
MLHWSSLDSIDYLTRLGTAVFIGVVFGINREIHQAPIGVRTLSLVAIGSSAAVILVAGINNGTEVHPDAVSRVLQGILTGIGFLGAGVILHAPDGKPIHGLTTAATIWVTAVLGIACGLGAWPLVLIAGILALIVLVLGGPVERTIHRWYDALNRTQSKDHDQR